eukprot:jgi/Ulvmu1/1324/UM011_0052.1
MREARAVTVPLFRGCSIFPGGHKCAAMTCPGSMESVYVSKAFLVVESQRLHAIPSSRQCAWHATTVQGLCELMPDSSSTFRTASVAGSHRARLCVHVTELCLPRTNNRIRLPDVVADVHRGLSRVLVECATVQVQCATGM